MTGACATPRHPLPPPPPRRAGSALRASGSGPACDWGCCEKRQDGTQRTPIIGEGATGTEGAGGGALFHLYSPDHPPLPGSDSYSLLYDPTTTSDTYLQGWMLVPLSQHSALALRSPSVSASNQPLSASQRNLLVHFLYFVLARVLNCPPARLCACARAREGKD